MVETGLKRFEDDIALVTGSTRGIGAATARRLASEGASVIVTGRSIGDGQRVVEEITANGGEATFNRADLRQPADVKSLIDGAVDRYSRIDVLVNNAAIQADSSVTELSIEEWERIIDIDFRSYWLCVKYAIEHMAPGSRIVNVSSNHAHATMPTHFPYNAIKAGINGMTRAMALDLGPARIRVNTVTPGWILIDRTERALSDEEQEHLVDIHPVGRIGKPDDVAGTIAWLVSNDAAFVTGADILVDGGRGVVMQDDVYTRHHRG